MGPGIEGPRPSADEALSRLIEGNQRFVRGAARREPFRTETLAALSSAQRYLSARTTKRPRSSRKRAVHRAGGHQAFARLSHAGAARNC